MNTIEFAYWLQGFLEMSGSKTMDERQVEMVRRHLALVFVNVSCRDTQSMCLEGKDVDRFLEALKLRNENGNTDAQQRFLEECEQIYKATKTDRY